MVLAVVVFLLNFSSVLSQLQAADSSLEGNNLISTSSKLTNPIESESNSDTNESMCEVGCEHCGIVGSRSTCLRCYDDYIWRFGVGCRKRRDGESSEDEMLAEELLVVGSIAIGFLAVGAIISTFLRSRRQGYPTEIQLHALRGLSLAFNAPPPHLRRLDTSQTPPLITIEASSIVIVRQPDDELCTGIEN